MNTHHDDRPVHNDQQKVNVPWCRVDVTPEQLRAEADRAVLYGACLLVLRPDVRIKPHLKEAVEALVPAVYAYYAAGDAGLAAHAAAYADACGGRPFLDQKAQVYRQRHAQVQD